jgi:hypothetical protein
MGRSSRYANRRAAFLFPAKWNKFAESQFSFMETSDEAGSFLTDDAVALEALGSSKRSPDIYV